jgi:hypothetical protein
MTTIEYNNLKADLASYKNKKEEVLQPLRQFQEDVKNGIKPPYLEDIIAKDVYDILDESPERKNFIKLANRTNNNPEYEIYFRAAFFEVFLGRIIDPLELKKNSY